jgi:drug/metabolite transporter (DMT)-like permease
VNNNIKAIILAMAALAVFTVLDTSAKYVQQTLPLQVAVFFRFSIAFTLAALILWRSNSVNSLATGHPYLQVLRGILLASSTFLNFFSMQYLQLAQIAAIFFTIPLWVCALSVPLLGEHVGWRRWMAVLIGFIGVVIIMRPGTGSFHWSMLVALVTAFVGAIYNIATRKVGAKDQAETSLFYVCLVGATLSVIPLPWTWQTPTGWQWLPLALMGIAGAGGHYMLIQAHRLAAASTIAPFIYSQIIWMILSGYLVFGQLPDFWTLAGAGIVVASGIYIFNRERQLGVATQATTPAD